jgi:N-acetylmuramic acid 6-phosphate etherase
MVLNMLSTGTMILLGKTYGNLMVDVQPTNRKLHHRAVGIVQQATRLARDAAEALLQEAGGEVKTAIIVGRTGIAPEQAREQLASHDQFLRRTLDTLDATK